MNTNQLNCFVEVAKTLSFARASENLYISQPAVSHQIRSLENELGCRLFYRTRQTVELTAAGEIFLSDALDILKQQTMAVTRARIHNTIFKETLKIGYDSETRIAILPGLFREYLRRMPQVYISNMLVNFSERNRMLVNNQLDLSFCYPEIISKLSDFCFVPIVKGHLSCVIPTEHRFSSKAALTTEELTGETLIFLSPKYCPPEIDRIQKTIQITCPNITVFFSDSVYITSQMILGGMGIAIIPDFACPGDKSLTCIPFETEQIVDYGVAYRPLNAPKKVMEFIHSVDLLKK